MAYSENNIHCVTFYAHKKTLKLSQDSGVKLQGRYIISSFLSLHEYNFVMYKIVAHKNL